MRPAKIHFCTSQSANRHHNLREPLYSDVHSPFRRMCVPYSTCNKENRGKKNAAAGTLVTWHRHHLPHVYLYTVHHDSGISAFNARNGKMRIRPKRNHLPCIWNSGSFERNSRCNNLYVVQILPLHPDIGCPGGHGWTGLCGQCEKSGHFPNPQGRLSTIHSI